MIVEEYIDNYGNIQLKFVAHKPNNFVFGNIFYRRNVFLRGIEKYLPSIPEATIII